MKGAAVGWRSAAAVRLQYALTALVGRRRPVDRPVCTLTLTSVDPTGIEPAAPTWQAVYVISERQADALTQQLLGGGAGDR